MCHNVTQVLLGQGEIKMKEYLSIGKDDQMFWKGKDLLHT